jgi:DNA-binding IclR family transcriptional regulator
VFDVLDLFTENSPTLSADDVIERLGVSRPTAFRHLRWLTEAGLLSRLAGRYALGPRIIELDYRSRRLDPLLLASRDVMAALAEETRCSAMLSGIFDDRVVNIHQDEHVTKVLASFGRGRVLPLFRGAASKVILAHLGAARLKRIYEAHGEDPDLQTLGSTLQAFNKYLRDIRTRGFYVSQEEVDEGIAGIGAPIFNVDGSVVGALTILFDLAEGKFFDSARLGEVVKRRAHEVSERLKTSGLSGE